MTLWLFGVTSVQYTSHLTVFVMGGLETSDGL